MFRLLKSFVGPSKTCVGTDKLGNKFFLVEHGQGVKRIVEFKNGELVPISTIPTLWRSWLCHKREHPPTIQELELEELKQKQFQERIRQMKEADEKLKLQEMGEREVNPQVIGGPNLTDLLKQLKSQTETHGGQLPQDKK